MRKLPNLKFEKKLWKKEFMVIGVDEVGRGALAGPLFAGAVCFSPSLKKDEIKILEVAGINDSKKVSPKKRKILATFIKKESLAWAVSPTSVSNINRFGISKATQKAMRSAISKINKKLKQKKVFVLADAFHIKYLKGIGLKNQKAIIHGDQISLSIAAASIVAKVERDKLMVSLSKKFSKYHWRRNKGYATQKHIKSIKKLGKTRLHRELFLRKITALY